MPSRVQSRDNIATKTGVGMKRAIIAVLGLVLVGCGGPDAVDQLTADLNAVRATATGEVIGAADGHDTYVWKGIPYAAAPTGDLRWRAPQPAADWEGRREAVSFGPSCPQFFNPISGMPGKDGDVVGNEDCLSLNIWAPRDHASADSEPLPVMLWIHGGGNTVGTAGTYYADVLASTQDVVVVTINYRLGLLGWFSHPALRETARSPEEASGNFGTLDTIAALQWVRDNIRAFGGDPNNVTIFGESAGGRDVYALLASPAARGLFHKAISQSGSLRVTQRAHAEHYTDDAERGMQNSSREVVARLLIADGKAPDRDAAKEAAKNMSPQDLSAWLRGRPADDLLNSAESGFAGMYAAPQIFADGTVLPAEGIRAALTAPGAQRVPFMTGSNRDEMKLFMAQDPGLVSSFLGFFVRVRDQAYYDRIAAYQSDHWKASAVDTAAAEMSVVGGAPVYAYRWDWDEGASNIFVDYPSLLGAAHALEISFVFGDFERSLVPAFFSDKGADERLRLSDAMMSYWTQFAHTGNPGQGRNGDLPEWGAWGGSDGDFVVLDTDQDGGIRMTDDGVTFANLKTQLINDTDLPGEMRCSIYAQLFFLFEGQNTLWDQAQFDGMGCAGKNPYDALNAF